MAVTAVSGTIVSPHCAHSTVAWAPPGPLLCRHCGCDQTGGLGGGGEVYRTTLKDLHGVPGVCQPVPNARPSTSAFPR
ncbi:unnamed protein product [Arctogadus glacialis]